MDINKLIEDVIDRYWNWRLLDIPEFATFVGEHRYDDRLMDMSLNGYLRRRDDARTWLDEARKIRKLTHADPPSNECKIHLDYLEHDVEVFLEGLTYQTYLCPMNQIDGPHIRFPMLLSWMKKDTVEDFQLILTRIRHFPRQITQIFELLTEGIRLNSTAYIKTVEPYPQALDEFCQIPLEDSGLFAPFKVKPDNISEDEWNKIVEDAKDIITNIALPEYKRLSVFMKNVYIPKARKGLGVGSLPNGKNIYEAYIRFHTDRDVTSEQIQKSGYRMIEELMVKFDEQQKRVGFKGTRREFIDHLRYDPKFGFTTREEMMEVYRKESDHIYSLLPKVFSKLPKMDYVIVPAPPEIEKEYVAGAYISGAVEKDRPGLFILNTYAPKGRRRYDVPAIILHEALPGHHIQLALTAESGLKDYRRFADELRYWDLPAHVGMKSPYHEGWATYAEFLGHELGLYDDVYTQIGSISRDLELACRNVIDVGMHVQEWSREKCIEFMMENTAMDALEIQCEVDRYISLPAQGISYQYGADKFKEYRRKAEKALGDKFDVKTFHTMLCSLGDVPLFIVEGQVDKFITDSIEIAA